jgi:hypothetical protein
MIEGIEDHRIAYRADQKSLLNHILMEYLELLLLCVGIGTRGSWRDWSSGSFSLISLSAVIVQEVFVLRCFWRCWVPVGHDAMRDLLGSVVDIIYVGRRFGRRGFTWWRRRCCVSRDGGLLGKKLLQSCRDA